MTVVAMTLKSYLFVILNYFKFRISNACAEGRNNKIEIVKEMACAFCDRDHCKIVIYFHSGGLDLYVRAGNP